MHCHIDIPKMASLSVKRSIMDALETKLLNSSKLKPHIWWRYIDDIFMIWEHGEEQLRRFLEDINSFHPSIKFTAEWSHESINFLDVQVINEGGNFVTDLYVKPTDTHQYLHASSCHVYHSKKSIPYSQTLRLNRVCSTNQLFDKRYNELDCWLVDRGYSERLVRNQVLAARKFSRDELLGKQKQPPKHKLTFNITYHPLLRGIKDILKRVHVLLAPDREHEKVFKDTPIVGFRRAKILKDMLVRAKLPKLEEIPGCSGCGARRCQVCEFVENATTFSDKDGSAYI